MDEARDTRPPENLVEVVGLLSTRRYYSAIELPVLFSAIELPVLFDFVTEVIEGHPSLVLQEIANNQKATITIEVPGSDTTQIHADR